MKLPKELFWDIGQKVPDFDKSATFIILRVIEKGGWEDVKAIFKYYGATRIKEVALGARYLPKKQLNFLSLYFNIPKEEFRCYKWQQLNPGLWNY